MPQLDDLQYEPSPLPPPNRSGGRWIWAVVVVALVIGAGAAFWRMNRTVPAPVDTAVAFEEPASPPPVELGAPADRAVELPPLAESDPFVRRVVQALSSHPQLVAWLVPNNLIDRFAASVDNIAEGRRPIPHLRVLAPSDSFVVAGSGGAATIDPRSYERYNLVADVVASIDAAGAARLYATLKPLTEEAYRQLGYPDRRFDDTLARAIRRLLETPVPEGTVRVVANEANYEYANAALENRSPVEKQFMRMGPRNVRLIQSKLREIARELGIEENRPSGD